MKVTSLKRGFLFLAGVAVLEIVELVEVAAVGGGRAGAGAAAGDGAVGVGFRGGEGDPAVVAVGLVAAELFGGEVG